MFRLHSSKFGVLAVAFALSPLVLSGQDPTAKQLVRTVVNNELAADSKDHSHWFYKDAKKTPEKSTLKLVVETPKGNVTRTVAVNGHPLTPEQQQQDEQKIQKLLTDPSAQQKQARDRHEDGQKARSMLQMLPDAFLWTKAGEEAGVVTLKFQPNRQFEPANREAQVFAAMAGTMTIDTSQMRLRSLKGALTQDVDFGWGLLGKLRKGGTFSIERAEVAPRVWEIVATHVHINGRALLFKSIDQNEDEETTGYKRVPDSLSLEQAFAMLKGDAAQTAQGGPVKGDAGYQQTLDRR